MRKGSGAFGTPVDIDADRRSRNTGLSAGGGIGDPSSWRMQSRGIPRAVSTGTVNAPKTYMDTMISTIVVVAKSVRWSCAFGNVCAQEKATAPRNPENQSMCCIAGGISPAVAGCCSSLRGDSCARSSRFSSPKGSPRLSSVASAWEKEFDRRLACSFLKRLLICRDLRGNQHLRRVRVNLHAIDATPARWRTARQSQRGHVIAEST